ncbi:MAG: hypothetical protein IPJ61_19980 [Tessaracoccus sp.]|uniref:hypothetical protein n=1 Tax=Tessaracoccus sp. TaxID=1971211 RepID=UPI001EB5AEF4|nr:hypothetical protein [Tessaracoccus sp.]MBK7823266.1 hypothetical protein [Tessaracoccus sp.]
MDLPLAALERFVASCSLDADAMAAKDPYLLYYLYAEEETPITPEAYDAFARERWSVEKGDPRRVRFVAWAMVDRARRAAGHSSVPWAAVRDTCVGACGVQPAEVQAAVRDAIVARALDGWRDAEGRAYVGLRALVEAERAIARSLRERLGLSPPAQHVLGCDDGEDKDGSGAADSSTD